jgi:hypothetical protein
VTVGKERPSLVRRGGACNLRASQDAAGSVADGTGEPPLGRANLLPDPGLANHLVWLVKFRSSNDVKQKSSSSLVGVGYHPSTKKLRRFGRGQRQA